MSKNADKNIDIEAKLFALADNMNSVVTREHQILQDELSQIGGLVNDAVKTLSDNFDNFTRLSMKQSRLMSDLLNHTDGTDLEQKQKAAIDLNDSVNENTRSVMRALQFDDIVQQLTAHSRHRAEQMELLFSSLANKLNDLRNHGQIQEEHVMKAIEAMLEDVERYRTALEKTSPVKQTTVKAGDIELF